MESRLIQAADVDGVGAQITDAGTAGAGSTTVILAPAYQAARQGAAAA